MTSEYVSVIANHLWQSTVFAAAVALLTLAFRSNSARVRYWLWLIASIKFLIPFSLLVALGSQLEWRAVPPPTQPGFSFVMEQVSEPFTAPVEPMPEALLPSTPQTPSPLPVIMLVVWACGIVTVSSSWLGRWWLVRAAVRASSPLRLQLPIPVLSSPTIVEPGVFGIFRPVIVLPEGITDRLTQPQLQAILAHELCHVRRRDNLAALVHMVIEAIFWFHPMLWWIGSRLVDEREQACDEEVLRLGSQPHVYAEGIIQVCKSYLASPMPCLSGVSGSNLKQRIERIMTQGVVYNMNFCRKLLLAAAAIAVVAGPIIIGLLYTPRTQAQTQVAPRAVPNPDREIPDWQVAAGGRMEFDVASVKQNVSSSQSSLSVAGNRYRATGTTLRRLIVEAYNLRDWQLTGGPSWITSDRWDIEAVADEGTPMLFINPEDPSRPTAASLMMQALIENRFQFKFHSDMKQLSVYELTVTRTGPKFKPSTDQQTPRNHLERDEIDVQALPVANFAWDLSRFLDRTLINKVDLTGLYDIKLQWNPDLTTEAESSMVSDKPSIFTALQEQLGLRLESTTGPVEVFVIDHVERPSDNSAAEIGQKPFSVAQNEMTPRPAPIPGPLTREGIAARPAFEVASIKPGDPDDRRLGIGTGAGGRFTATNAPVKRLLRFAYEVNDDQIIGVPSAIENDRYTIVAMPTEGTVTQSPEGMAQVRLMVKALLAERFRLALHQETRELPIYELGLARNGPKLAKAQPVDCAETQPASPCFEGIRRSRLGNLTGQNTPLSILARTLTDILQRSVLDRSALRGNYDFTLTWTPDESLEPPVRGDPGQTPPDPNGPSLFTALEEQLGLKLESKKGPVEVLVIDHIERPSANDAGLDQDPSSRRLG